jgi:hypothetical protein
MRRSSRVTSTGSAPVTVAKEHFFKVGELCHPRCLGEWAPYSVPYAEWARLLEQMETTCARAFNRIEHEIDALRATERDETSGG